MIVVSGIVAVYLEFQLLPGALNSLETRFKTHFITRVVLLVIACYFGFQLTWLISSSSSSSGAIIWFDGVCKTSSTLFQFEIVLVFLAGAIIQLLGVTGKQPELVLVLVANLIGIIYMVTSNDWQITITGWEQFNISLYLLVSLSGSTNSSPSQSSNSLSAAMKYFLLSALVTTFMLLAVSLIYSSTGTTNYDNCSVSLVMQSSNFYLNNMNYLLIVTLLWKLGAAPVHSWAPDLYDTVSMPVVLWMIIIPKLAVFGQIMQIYHVTSDGVNGVIGVITVLTGSIGIAFQWRIVRFISYSAITHLGFQLLTITSFHVTGYLYYIAIYAITNINQFAIIVKYCLGNPHDLSGMFRMNLTMSQSWAQSFFSLAGIPPLAGFYAKFLILSSQLNSRTTLNLFIIAIIASALTLANYLNLVKLTHFYLPNQHTKACYLVSFTTVSYFISLLQFSLLVLGWSVLIPLLPVLPVKYY